jgi:CRP/FNR family cyclic AMP-dependent transcriptional regulator
MARGVPKQVIDWLGAVPLFSTCSKAELRAIASLGTELNVAAGRVLTEQGKPGREFFLVISGTARCEINGKRVATFGPGDFFGEMALIDRGPRTATVTAETPMELLVLDSREFNELLDASPSISKKLLLAFAARRREDDAFTH